MNVMGWELIREDGDNLVAVSPRDDAVTVRVRDQEIVVHDDKDYSPSGQYSIPLAVIEALRSRGPR